MLSARRRIEAGLLCSLQRLYRRIEVVHKGLSALIAVLDIVANAYEKRSETPGPVRRHCSSYNPQLVQPPSIARLHAGYQSSMGESLVSMRMEVRKGAVMNQVEREVAYRWEVMVADNTTPGVPQRLLVI